jgi:DNA-binding transcriptional regulator YiaG
MKPSEVKEARNALGLTLREFAEMLDTDDTTTRKMELQEGSSQYRRPAPRMIRLIVAYLKGYRPSDWPK